MIRQISRALSGLALSVLAIYLTLRILVWHHGEISTFQARVEALVLGVSMAMLATLVSSIVHLKLKRKLETTRIEEWVIGFTSFGSEVDEYIGEALAPTYNQQSDVPEREYICIENLPALEPLEEIVR